MFLQICTVSTRAPDLKCYTWYTFGFYFFEKTANVILFIALIVIPASSTGQYVNIMRLDINNTQENVNNSLSYLLRLQ